MYDGRIVSLDETSKQNTSSAPTQQTSILSQVTQLAREDVSTLVMIIVCVLM